MKKSVTLIIAVLVLGLLMVLLFFTNQKKDSTGAPASPQTSTETIVATDNSTTEEASISFLNIAQQDLESFTITSGEDTLTFVPGEENWTLKGYEDVEVDQSALNFRAKTILAASATRKIENATLSEYGLDAPSKTVTYTLKDGSSQNLLVGSLSLDSTSAYVTLESVPTTVYMIPALTYNCLTTDASTFRKTATEAPEAQQICELHISGTDFETMHVVLGENQNGIVTDYTLTTDTLNKVAINTNSFSNLVNAIPTIQAEDVLADNVTDLSPYGLDNPKLHLTIHFYDSSDSAATTSDGVNSSAPVTSTLDFIWGDTLEDGKIAFMKNGEKSVYAMDASFMSGLKEVATPFYLCSKYVALCNIQEVSNIQITFPDASYQIAVDYDNDTYSINNQNIASDDFKPVYRSIIGIYGELVLDEVSTDATPQITITYTLKDGSTKEALFTNATSNQYYQTTLNGSMIVGCSKTQLNALQDTLNSILAQ